MTKHHTTEGGHHTMPALGSLIDIAADEFAADFWGRRPLLSRGKHHQLLTLDDVDSLLSERGLRTPFVRLTKEGVVVPPAKYTTGGGAGASIADQVSGDQLVELLLDGVTVVLQALHRTWRPITDLVTALSQELGVPVQANAYVTPPDSRGFDNHYDVHDVFVIQLAGTKHWQVHAPVHVDPLPDQPWNDHRDAVQKRTQDEPLLDVTLEPGDVLYLPRGTVHGAVSEDGVSAHLTLGLHPVTGYAAATAALGLLKDRAELRASLPAGLRLDSETALDTIEAVRKQLHTAIDALDPAEIATALAKAVLPQTRPAPLGPLAQLVAIDSAGPVRLRAGLQTHLTGTTLITPLTTVTVDEAELSALQALLAGQTLPAGPLATRLLRAGIATPG